MHDEEREVTGCLVLRKVQVCNQDKKNLSYSCSDNAGDEGFAAALFLSP